MTTNSDVSTRRRVKLYMLNDERQWDDKGTGHVSATFLDQSSMALVVISETDGSHLLESKIQHDTAYQKQQETLIVWSEGESMDLALSFQEKTGCDDIWEKICTVQGKDPSVDITQDLVEEGEEGEDMELDTATGGTGGSALGSAGGMGGSVGGVEFPVCDMAHLGEICELFTQVANYPIQRERLATALERSNYIKQIIDLFRKAESIEDFSDKKSSLHYFYDISRSIIQFNRRNLLEIIFSEEFIMDFVGMLEYSNPTGKMQNRVKHREFLEKRANFKEIIPIIDLQLKSKIHQTYRVQYIQDSCMPPPSLFDDNAGASLQSFIYLNKIDIITKLQQENDNQFLTQLFTGLQSQTISIDNRRDLLSILKDFCQIINSLQIAQKESFFASLNVNRALKSIFFSLKIVDDAKIKSICLDLLQIFVENQSSVVREFFLNDSREKINNNNNNSESQLEINCLIDQLINDVDCELSNGFIVTAMLKVLFDPENMINTTQRNEKQEFLNFLYKHSIGYLLRPLVNYTTSTSANGELKHDDYHTACLLHDIVELAAFCVEFHSYHMKNYLFHHHNTLLNIVSLFKSRHRQLQLAALRVVRRFIGSREEFNYRFIIKNNILRYVIDLLDDNPGYNMVNSAILEMFEFIRTENITCLINYIIDYYNEGDRWSIVLSKHNYTNIFTLLKARYDQSLEKSIKNSVNNNVNNNMLSLMNVTSSSSATAAVRLKRGINNRGSNNNSSLMMEEDEEQWYDQDDNEDEESSAVVTAVGGSPHFVERYSRALVNKESSDSVDDDDGVASSSSFKQSSAVGRYCREQPNISINIKSTNLTLGTPAAAASAVSSSTATAGCLSSSMTLTNGILSGDTINEYSRKVCHISSTDSVKSVVVAIHDLASQVTPTSGLVDYTSDDDDEDNDDDNDDNEGGVVGGRRRGDGESEISTTSSTSESKNSSSSKDSQSEWSALASPKRLKTE